MNNKNYATCAIKRAAKSCRRLHFHVNELSVGEVWCQINGTCWVCFCEEKAREIYFKEGCSY